VAFVPRRTVSANGESSVSRPSASGGLPFCRQPPGQPPRRAVNDPPRPAQQHGKRFLLHRRVEAADNRLRAVAPLLRQVVDGQQNARRRFGRAEQRQRPGQGRLPLADDAELVRGGVAQAGGQAVGIRARALLQQLRTKHHFPFLCRRMNSAAKIPNLFLCR
jgi:hypothetical protein